jgi:hypothetical protein
MKIKCNIQIDIKTRAHYTVTLYIHFIFLRRPIREEKSDNKLCKVHICKSFPAGVQNFTLNINFKISQVWKRIIQMLLLKKYVAHSQGTRVSLKLL